MTDPPAPLPRDAVLDGGVTGPTVHPSGPVHLTLRLLLLAVIAVGVLGVTQQPVTRSVDDLVAALDAGEVATVTLERIDDGTTSAQVRWTGPGRTGSATYVVAPAGATGGDEGTAPPDDRRRVLDAAAGSPRAVDVRTTDTLPPAAPWGLGLTAATLLALGTLGGALVLLVAGPEPRLATRWAWFWMTGGAWPVWLAYLLLEPTPAWSRRTVVGPVRRLTGGWAFLAQMLLAPLLMRALTGS